MSCYLGDPITCVAPVKKSHALSAKKSHALPASSPRLRRERNYMADVFNVESALEYIGSHYPNVYAWLMRDYPSIRDDRNMTYKPCIIILVLYPLASRTIDWNNLAVTEEELFHICVLASIVNIDSADQLLSKMPHHMLQPAHRFAIYRVMSICSRPEYAERSARLDSEELSAVYNYVTKDVKHLLIT